VGRDHRPRKVAAETGVVMLLYLDQAYDRFKQEGRMRSLGDLQEAIEDGAVKRIRPKMMAVMAILMGLLPIMWSHGAGADVMKRIATPMVGGRDHVVPPRPPHLLSGRVHGVEGARGA
jgi:Cu(I)/Ag(I) efflux system membrane protein CusA/SilA